MGLTETQTIGHVSSCTPPIPDVVWVAASGHEYQGQPGPGCLQDDRRRTLAGGRSCTWIEMTGAIDLVVASRAIRGPSCTPPPGSGGVPRSTIRAMSRRSRDRTNTSPGSGVWKSTDAGESRGPPMNRGPAGGALSGSDRHRHRPLAARDRCTPSSTTTRSLGKPPGEPDGRLWSASVAASSVERPIFRSDDGGGSWRQTSRGRRIHGESRRAPTGGSSARCASIRTMPTRSTCSACAAPRVGGRRPDVPAPHRNARGPPRALHRSEQLGAIWSTTTTAASTSPTTAARTGGSSWRFRSRPSSTSTTTWTSRFGCTGRSRTTGPTAGVVDLSDGQAFDPGHRVAECARAERVATTRSTPAIRTSSTPRGSTARSHGRTWRPERTYHDRSADRGPVSLRSAASGSRISSCLRTTPTPSTTG